jgi:hypothetical protein
VKDANTVGTEFETAAQTTGAITENAGPSSLRFPLMSPEGARLAAKSAPASATEATIARPAGRI